MNGLRRQLSRHRFVFAWLLAASLAMKLVVPAGFMLVASAHSFSILFCDEHGEVAMPAGHVTDGHDDHSKSEQAQTPCAFGLLSSPTLAAADPILLAVAIAFIVTVLFRATPAFVVQRGTYLRPPPQGPPHTA